MTTKESECNIPEEIDYTAHWNAAYVKNPTEKLGWFEERSKETIQLLKTAKVPRDAKILNVGVGSSMIIDELVADGYSGLIANDLSEKALNDIQNRLGASASKVRFITDDLMTPTKLQELNEVDVWNDRAVLHFFLKEEEQNAYFSLLKKLVKVNGFVIIAVFALDGAEKCCGLQLQRYNTAMLQEKLGNDFVLIDSFNHTFVNPYGGERPYIYTLFQRKSK
ncbi:class I SAM-dependent methyltransferase [Tenacibaculum tangerinum]|uniref:Class I SAM-dependent methyltransferase n=1 Tax=Tenacibaculum tangerinum TaxID=3038772 RepID=A0ABY8L362_9FLAO|nr:class I SAM-dependent methyltransferase [Tenacibaculum tangerinum]WGH75526.1 class I SAM-dependent methyltransferase [Tenacibaculum tangerinum]